MPPIFLLNDINLMLEKNMEEIHWVLITNKLLALAEASVTVSQHNPHIKALYQRLQERGKTKMSALGAAMRKLVHLCFGVLKTRQPYQAIYAI